MLLNDNIPLLAFITGAFVSYSWYKYLELNQLLEHEKRKRADERAGRTQAEKQLRQLQQQQLTAISQSPTTEQVVVTSSAQQKKQKQQTTEQQVNSVIAMQPIGYLSSVYNGRNGTPRQGMFVPSGRALLKLQPRCNPKDSLDGLQEYSHCWLIFVFHENTNYAKQQILTLQNSDASTPTSRNNASVTKSKVKPPRLLNRTVGLYSTRSPHRHNNIGLTLAKIDQIDQNGVLHLSAIDLCDGTPILDIKPYIEYDIVNDLQVPDWIKDPISSIDKFQVTFDGSSLNQLTSIMKSKKLKLYKPHEQQQVEELITQVLQLDMRSYHKKTTNSNTVDQHVVNLDRLKIAFTISSSMAVQVTGIEYIPSE